MGHIQANAARRVADAIEDLEDGRREFADALDDGSIIAVAIEISGRRLAIDFSGSSPAHPGTSTRRARCRWPPCSTCSAVWSAHRFPLNSGCLEPIELTIPPDSILDPEPGRAVAGGNVETSQRVVDVLLGALGASRPRVRER